MVLFPKLKNNYLVFNHINDLSSLIIISRFDYFNNEYPTLNIQYSISPQARKKLMKTENTKKVEIIDKALKEGDELIVPPCGIKSIDTAQKNKANKLKK